MGYKLLITEDGRECEKCREHLSWDSYSRNKSNKTGYQSRCKLCCSSNAENYKTRMTKAKKEPGFNLMAQLFILGKMQ